MKKDTLAMIALVLTIIGGLNWGLVGLLNLDLVKLIFGFMPLLQQIIYILVGLSALYLAYAEFKE
ncbi:MAG: DUF378 domain-containing protein [Candidatus Micrarchaeota archaeon]|nr:DUF378 domain-containing protein [Candidatus Micrarchaeota archaeon]